jgi:hypothetical protein
MRGSFDGGWDGGSGDGSQPLGHLARGMGSHGKVVHDKRSSVSLAGGKEFAARRENDRLCLLAQKRHVWCNKPLNRANAGYANARIVPIDIQCCIYRWIIRACKHVQTAN